METIRILHLDPDKGWQKLVRDCLTPNREIQVVSPAEPLREYRMAIRENYHLVICEMDLSPYWIDRVRRRGLEVARQISEEKPQLPIMFLTIGLTVDRIYRAAEIEGVRDVITKFDIPNSSWLAVRIRKNLRPQA